MPGNSAFRSKPTIGNASPNTGDAQAEVARSRSGRVRLLAKIMPKSRSGILLAIPFCSATIT